MGDTERIARLLRDVLRRGSLDAELMNRMCRILCELEGNGNEPFGQETAEKSGDVGVAA